MKNHYNIVNVFFAKNSEKIPMGRLLLKDRKIFFEYTNHFFLTGLELSPFKLPLKPGVITCQENYFEGLFGIFNDSLPDGWGRLLLDRKLLKKGIHPNEVTPLDRLCYVGSNGMGALLYEPEIDHQPIIIHNDLDELADECLEILDDDNDQYVEDLLAMSGSSSGARPKILVKIIKNKFIPSYQSSEKYEDWIIKFRSSNEATDAGTIEYAYHLMAKEAGLNVPKAKLFKSKKYRGFFGVKRFDRDGSNRIHMHTVSGLLHIDHRSPSFDYASLLKLTMVLTRNIRECEIQFRNAIFNVLTRNRDDHVKNFSFVMDTEGNWKVSPAYDLTFSPGPAGEHCTTIMGEGKNPSSTHLIKLGESVGIDKSKALTIIEEIKQAVSKWPMLAEQAKVTKKSITIISSALKQYKS